MTLIFLDSRVDLDLRSLNWICLKCQTTQRRKIHKLTFTESAVIERNLPVFWEICKTLHGNCYSSYLR